MKIMAKREVKQARVGNLGYYLRVYWTKEAKLLTLIAVEIDSL